MKTAEIDLEPKKFWAEESLLNNEKLAVTDKFFDANASPYFDSLEVHGDRAEAVDDRDNFILLSDATKPIDAEDLRGCSDAGVLSDGVSELDMNFAKLEPAELMTLQLRINDSSYEALVDTGASTCLIKENLLKGDSYREN